MQGFGLCGCGGCQFVWVPFAMRIRVSMSGPLSYGNYQEFRYPVGFMLIEMGVSQNRP